MFTITAEVLDRSRFHFARSRRGQNVTESPGDEKKMVQTTLPLNLILTLHRPHPHTSVPFSFSLIIMDITYYLEVFSYLVLTFISVLLLIHMTPFWE